MSSASAPSRPSLPPRALRFARRPLALIAACLAVAGTQRLAAQNPGDLDTSFTAGLTQVNLYANVYENVAGVPYVFAAGDLFGLELLDGVGGTALATFEDPGFGGASRIVYAVVPELVGQTEGGAHYLLLGGLFGRSADQVTAKTAAQNVVRLTPFGMLDATYNPGGKGANGFVDTILPLPDGGSVIGGGFTTYNKLPRAYLARLDANGVPVDDSVFSGSLTFDANVLSVAAQMVDGSLPASPQILVAGLFGNVNGQSHSKLVRLNADGSVDGTFNPSFDARTTVVASQPDGKILVGGDFENVNGQAIKHFVRLNYDGSIDTTFAASVTGQPTGFVDPPAVYVVKLLDNGSMYLGGNFTTVNGTTRDYLARVFADGTLDPVFNANGSLVNVVQSISLQINGELLVGLNRSKANGNNVYPPVLQRLYAEAPAVTLAVNKPNAREQPIRNGRFTLTRGGNATAATGSLTVYLQLSGTEKLPLNAALEGVNSYNAQEKIYSVTLTPGQTAASIRVAPNGTEIRNPVNGSFSRTVTLTVIADPTGANAYSVSGQTATVTIAND